MNAIWEKSFADFAGPGIDHPSDAMRVDDDEAESIIANLAAREDVPTILRPSGRHRACVVGHIAGTTHTLLLAEKRVVGFYVASYLWIARSHRGHGLSIPLILAAALHRAGCALPPGVAFQGYTRAGLAAHRSAHASAVGAAVAAGLPVPPPVLAEWHAQTNRRRLPVAA